MGPCVWLGVNTQSVTRIVHLQRGPEEGKFSFLHQLGSNPNQSHSLSGESSTVYKLMVISAGV